MEKSILSDKTGGFMFISIMFYITVVNLFSVCNPFDYAPAFLKWVLLILLAFLGTRLAFRYRTIFQTAKRFNTELEQVHRKMVVVMEGISIEQAAETSEHIKNVSELSFHLALAYGLSHEDAEIIRLASPLHDVGKVAIPLEILNKPARLTPEEFEIVKKHSLAGYEALKNTNHRILDVAAIIALQHHEKYNGKGYPKGLKGDQIHIYAQITAIADVFDALMSTRVYKMSYSLFETIRIIKKERGEHFSPEIVDLFLEMITKNEEVKKKILTK